MLMIATLVPPSLSGLTVSPVGYMYNNGTSSWSMGKYVTFSSIALLTH